MLDAVKDHAKFIKRWGPALLRNGCVTSRPRSGRPSKVTDEVARAACETFKAGFVWRDGVVRHFHSIGEACNARNGPLRPLLIAHNVSARTLLSRMLEVDRNLVRVKEAVKWPFSTAQKKARREAAAALLATVQADPLFWQRVVFLDQKKLWVNIGARFVYVDKRQGEALIANSAFDGKLRACCLSFYIAVSALVGPVALVFVTGTTGHVVRLNGRKMANQVRMYNFSLTTRAGRLFYTEKEPTQTENRSPAPPGTWLCT